MIDSLNAIDNHEKKVELSRKIALRLKNSDWERAVKYIELAEAEAKKTATPDLALAGVYVTAGEIYDSKDVLDVSLEYYLKAYDIYKEMNNVPESARLENNLAILYAKSNNQEKALQFFAHVYKYQKAKNDPVKLAKILNNIGTIYLDKNPDSSLYYYQKAHLLTNKLNDNKLSVYVYTNLARAYAFKKDKKNADLNFKKAFDLLNFSKDNSLKAFVHESFSEYNLQENNLENAILNAKQALELNKDKSFGFSAMRLNKMLYHAYLSKQDYKNAVYYFEQYSKISDSINIEQKAVNLERIRLEQDYKVRNKIRTLEEEQKRFKYYVIGLILVVGILFLIILLIKYRNRNIKNQLEKEKLKAKQQELNQSLEAKNMVLVGKAMAEIQRTDNINEILTDLKMIKLKTPNKELQQAIDIVLKRLEKDLNTDIWKEFEISFEQVHKSFFDRLTIDYPTLTPKERRLCALLYLDLTTKEISQITGQSFKSIENARTRLRKKFDLTNEKVNLSTYLNSFKGETM
ncbi:tetratricopeptide repeat protein [Flavobacterium sp. P21]|uniref:tetratricopeptide repeat protein n=1 Tax=Flavobacterium sp. P21 TaxID=3423948 RepID=UPI003D677269